MAEASATPAISTTARPPVEVVLPLGYYLLLLVEVAALTALHLTHPEESGGDRIGYLLGWTGTACMLVMHVYSLRRRVRALRSLGPLRAWLHFHIFMGLSGALLVAYHASHLRTLGNFAGLNLACVLVVVASGMFGRYLFAMIPKGLSGERLTLHGVEEELARLERQIAGHAPTAALAKAIADYAGGARLSSPRASLRELAAEDLRARRSLTRLDAALEDAFARPLAGATLDTVQKMDAFAAAARRRVLLARRAITLAAAERLFRLWTFFHKPLTFLLLALTVLHVLTHYLYAAAFGA